MRPFHRLTPLFIAALALSACSPAASAPSEIPPLTSQATVRPSESADPAANVRTHLAAQLKIDPEEIHILHQEPVDWPDACLGLPHANETCTPQTTPGFRWALSAEDQTYIFHSDQRGQIIRQEPTHPATRENMPNAAGKAVKWLAQQTGDDPNQIEIMKIEAVDWPNACLGVMKSGIVCAEVITPGYRILLQTSGKNIEIHTNRDGSSIVATDDISAVPAALTWELQGETCQTAQVNSTGIRYGICQGQLQEAAFTGTSHAAELALLEQTYSSFTADTPTGKVTFTGQGMQTATPAEQRSLAEWARRLVMEASAPNNANYGLVFTWQRSGGVAGMCAALRVYLSGFATASTCKGKPDSTSGFTRLKADQLEQLYAWTNSLHPFEIHLQDPATADALDTTLIFSGTGGGSADESTRQALLDLAAEVYAAVPLPQP